VITWETVRKVLLEYAKGFPLHSMKKKKKNTKHKKKKKKKRFYRVPSKSEVPPKFSKADVREGRGKDVPSRRETEEWEKKEKRGKSDWEKNVGCPTDTQFGRCMLYHQGRGGKKCKKNCKKE